MADLHVNKKTDLTINFQYYESDGITKRALTGATVLFTVKIDESDADATDTSAVLKKSVTVHTNAANGLSAITLSDDDTNIDPFAYHYDIKVKESDDKIYLVQSGRFIINPSVTNRTA
jgi:hypothetical protein